MSSTGSLRRIERAPLSAAFTRQGVATAIAALLFTVILVSFRPFQPAGEELTGDGGDIVNQLGFGSLGAVSIFALLAFADPRVVRRSGAGASDSRLRGRGARRERRRANHRRARKSA